MDLLNNLIQFGNIQSTSLSLCQSPNGVQPNYATPFMSAKKQPIPETDRPRPASKSLSKMSFFSPTQKIDPKERIIHRLVYKLQMKFRKNSYNFFVKLQNFKRKPVNMKNSKLVQVFPKAIQKLNQLADLLFSKYFERSLVKNGFKKIKNIAIINQGIRRIDQIICKVKYQQYFSKLFLHCKQVQKNYIRIDILASSLKSFAQQKKKETIKQLKSYAFKNICKYYSKPFNSHSPKTNGFEILKETGEKDIPEPVESFCLIKQMDIIPHPTYQQLKSIKDYASNFPTKTCNRINLKISKKSKTPFQNGVQLKTCSLKEISLKPIQCIFSNEMPNNLIKKCEIDILNSKQVNDIYDNNTLFFPKSLKQNYTASSQLRSESQFSPFSQSIVQSIRFQHSQSQVSLISPLNQNLQQSYLNFSVSSTRSNTFGLQAVNFKNSLVCERESMKEHCPGERKVYKDKQLILKNSRQARTQNYQMPNFLKLRLADQDLEKNDKNLKVYSQYSRNAEVESNRIQVVNSSRPSIIQSDQEKRFLKSRRSIDQSKITSTKDEGRRQQQTFLKITKKN